MADAKVRRYREAYATRPGVTYAFLPCVMSTSGRIHGEFLRFLYILAHRRTKGWFERLGYEPAKKPSSSAADSTSGTRVPLSVMPRRSRYPAARASPSAPFVAIAPTGTPLTTSYIRPRLRWLSE